MKVHEPASWAEEAERLRAATARHDRNFGGRPAALGGWVSTLAPLESPAEQTGCAGESVRQTVERVTYDHAQKLVRSTVRKEFGQLVLPLARLGHQEKRGRLARTTRLMALAVHCEELLRTGTVQDYAEMARLGMVSCPRMTQVMNLLNLAPEIQEEVLFLPEVEEGPEPVSERALRRQRNRFNRRFRSNPDL